jgi:alcohol dehydrogenase
MIISNQTSFFAQPKFLVGSRAMEHLQVELDGLNACRPMVLTTSKSSKYVKKFIRSLAESNITIGALVDNVLPYVNINEIKKLAGLYTWRECDSVIAIGGDFLMDNAKALAAYLSNNTFDFSQKEIIRTIPLVYIATPNIDGMEVTTRLNIDGKHFFSDSYYPDIACIDSSMVVPVCSKQRILPVALGTMAYCIEGAANQPISPFVDASALTAIQLIAQNLETVAEKPKDSKANLALLNGIAIGGLVRSNSKKGIACHTAELLAKETGYSSNLIAGLLISPSLQIKMELGMEIRKDLLLALCGIDYFCSVANSQKDTESIRVINQLAALSKVKLKSLNIQDQIFARVCTTLNDPIATRFFEELTLIIKSKTEKA